MCKKKICDACGEPYNGKSYPMYDENYNLQLGLKQCYYCAVNKPHNNNKGTQRSPFGIGA